MFGQPHTATCTNCGKQGHTYFQCKYPITSVGVIAVRWHPTLASWQFLMVRRAHTFGFMEIMRGKYPLTNHAYMQTVINEMSAVEQESLLTKPFTELWSDLWGRAAGIQFRNEEAQAQDKLEQLKRGVQDVNGTTFSLQTLIEAAPQRWPEPEWEFPKGRHNSKENDLACALREFEEETKYRKSEVAIIHNVAPLEEIFTGSNYKAYRYKYYVGVIDWETPERDLMPAASQIMEVSEMRWFTLAEAQAVIRSYHLEKLSLVSQVHTLLTDHSMVGN
jgi:8-oxo-dGTP pyrophosphatase MutT (NUDIX family)